ncbi:MAG: peptidoglycan DD-metalloendopeptidase family protein [Pseudomonadota bacterium]
MSGRAVLCAVLALSMALPTSGALAAAAGKPTARSKQKAAAEATRAGIQQKLSALKRDISRTEDAREDAADTLAASEQAISDANRELRVLAEEQGQTNAKLETLTAAQQQLALTIERQKKQVATLLRAHYVAGNEDRLKLLLSGDNPNRINRDLQQMAFVSQSQARLLASLRGNLAQVEANRLAAQEAKDELEEIAQEERAQKGVLEKEKAQRAVLLGTLSKRLVSQRKEIGTLERDEQRMAGLVDKLSQLIREQAEAAAAEQRRREAAAAAKALAKARAEADAKALAAAKAQAERERIAALKAAKPGTRPVPARPEPVPDEPRVALQPPRPAEPRPAEPKPVEAAPAKPDIALGPAAAEGAFASLRGRLRVPVAGKLGARFGAKRGSGPSWKGVFIKADEGSDVKAVANGRVVFARWMRGFGNLIIVDHGSQYMSIYGNNQALLKQEGDAVKGGDSIASAGDTGGNEESGLYFELRHHGKAFDPAGWVAF